MSIGWYFKAIVRQNQRLQFLCQANALRINRNNIMHVDGDFY